jgi:hypothetical protein
VPSVSTSGGGTSSDRCTGQIASQLFRYALCACDSVSLSGALRTAAFDSSKGPFMPGGATQTGASVGVNQTLSAVGTMDIGGSLTVGGVSGMSFPGMATVRGDLRVRGPLSYFGEQTVARDVWLQGVLNGVGVLHVGGDLHQTPSVSRSLINAPVVGGRDLRDSVQVDPPCACEPSQVLDVAAIVADGAKRNHNAEVGLDPDALVSVLGTRRQELECGRLFLSRISGVGDLTLSVKGRTALFVQYDVSLSGNLTIELGPEGALDLFVGGTLAFAGDQDFGDPSRAARIRMYVASNRAISIAGDTAFVGNLYAPHSAVSIVGDTNVYGAIFAGTLSRVGDTNIFYDSAIVREGDACDPPPRCDSCEECGATAACSNGACGPCRSDADCCKPLTCSAGRCGVLVL